MNSSHDVRMPPDVFNCLRKTFPITGLIHIGAGSGFVTGRYTEWAVPKVALIEAEAGLFKKLSLSVANRSDWSAHCELLAENEGDKTFYVTTNPNENGILPPEKLTFLWRNLKAREQSEIRTSTLQNLLEMKVVEPEAHNWVVIDCMPALPILNGAGRFIERWDVVVVRVLVDGQPLGDAGATKGEVGGYLEGAGYRCIDQHEEKLPAIATLVYIRDWKALHARQITAIAEMQVAHVESDSHAVAEVKQYKTRLDQLAQMLEEQKVATVSAQKRVEQLQSEQDEKSRLQALQLQQAAQLLDEHKKIAATAQQKVDQLTREYDDKSLLQGLQLAERQAQLTQGKLALERVITDRQADAGRFDEANGNLRRQLDERGTEIARLEHELAAWQSKYESASQGLAKRVDENAELQVAMQKFTKEREEQAEQWALERRGFSDQIAALHVDIEARSAAFSELEAMAAAAKAESNQKEANLQHQAELLAAKDAHVAQLEAALTQQEGIVAERVALAAAQGQELDQALQRLEEMKQTRDEFARLLAEREASLVARTRDHDEYARVARERLAHIEALQQKQNEQSEQLTKARADCDLQAAQATERMAQIERLSRDHDEHARVSRERLGHIEKLINDAEGQAKQLAQLQNERAELDFRQRLLDEELVKAEAQIELIKDVVLREKAF